MLRGKKREGFDSHDEGRKCTPLRRLVAGSARTIMRKKKGAH